MKLICWNIARREPAWKELVSSDADVVLLQEANQPPADIAERIHVDDAPWTTAGAKLKRDWRTAVVGLSDHVKLKWLAPKSIEDASPSEFRVSHLGTIAAAELELPDQENIFVVSVYAPWESPVKSTESNWIYADASAHRIISDLSALIGLQTRHRVIVAGDFNSLYGYGEDGSPYWAGRYQTIFDRLESIGLAFVGPQYPNGLRADPWPEELPKESKNVPTFHSTHQNPTTATRQLDFVFASKAIADRLEVKALNEPEEWGPSDHCRIEIQID